MNFNYPYLFIMLAIIVIALMLPRTEHFENPIKSPVATMKEDPPASPRASPRAAPRAAPHADFPIDCPFPLEKYQEGCRLRCPTTTFLLNNPRVFCQKVVSGGVVEADDEGNCPPGYISDPAGCVKLLTACPPSLELKDGACYERCPPGTGSAMVDVEIQNDKGFVEKAKVRVCQK